MKRFFRFSFTLIGLLTVSAVIAIPAAGTREDEKNPGFRKMSRISWNGSFHFRARTDLYARNARRFNAFLKQAGWNFLFVHAPDTGGSRDPEEWPRREQAARERFGDDRAAAGSAVFLEFRKAMENTDVKRMIALIYPYSGRCPSRDCVREILNFPAAPEGKEAAEANVRRERACLSRMHALLPEEGISFSLREGRRDVDISLECRNVRCDIPVLVPPEQLSTASAFEPERGGRNDMWTVDGGVFKEPERVMFAERSRNCMGEYSAEPDRSRNPLSYDRKALDFPPAEPRRESGGAGPERNSVLCLTGCSLCIAPLLRSHSGRRV